MTTPQRNARIHGGIDTALCGIKLGTRSSLIGPHPTSEFLLTVLWAVAGYRHLGLCNCSTCRGCLDGWCYKHSVGEGGRDVGRRGGEGTRRPKKARHAPPICTKMVAIMAPDENARRIPQMAQRRAPRHGGPGTAHVHLRAPLLTTPIGVRETERAGCGRNLRALRAARTAAQPDGSKCGRRGARIANSC